jgi:hypothetical protein
MENLEEKGILTIAIGKKYNRWAKYLAYSCILHSPSLPRAIITDDCKYFNGLYDVIIPYTADMGDPFFVKLKLQHYSPFFETLFLDSDTLVYTDLRFMWDYFGSQSIIYAGTCLKEGTWYFKEIGDILKYYDIPWVGKLNSGVFLFRKDETGINVLNYAAELHEDHGDINIPLLGNKMLPDEPFLAVAFGKYNQLPKDEFGRHGRSLIKTKNVKINIIRGISKFTKEGKAAFPSVVHFVGGKDTYYIEEKIKLLFFYKGIPICIYYFSVYIVMKFIVLFKFVKRCINYIKRHFLSPR